MNLTLRVTPSSEDGQLLTFLSTMLAAYTNAHMHSDLKDIPEAEKQAEITRLKNWIEELLH